MLSTYFVGLSALLAALMGVTFRYEFEMPATVSALMIVPALLVGAILASVVTTFLEVPLVHVVAGLNAAFLLIVGWTEVRSQPV